VTFDLGSARPQYDTAALNALVAWLNSHADTNLIVDGHSDSTGSAAVNLGLSQRRANEMVKRIVAVNFPHDRITRRAFGNYTPVVGARQDSARNRRVVLSIAGLKDCPESESQ
jgi:outer membrane protein OmpA-like peptidoglycan-associated protein